MHSWYIYHNNRRTKSGQIFNSAHNHLTRTHTHAFYYSEVFCSTVILNYVAMLQWNRKHTIRNLWNNYRDRENDSLATHVNSIVLLCDASKFDIEGAPKTFCLKMVNINCLNNHTDLNICHKLRANNGECQSNSKLSKLFQCVGVIEWCYCLWCLLYLVT